MAGRRGLANSMADFLSRNLSEGQRFTQDKIGPKLPKLTKVQISGTLTTLKNRGVIEMVAKEGKMGVYMTLPQLYQKAVPQGSFNNAQLGKSILDIVSAQRITIIDLRRELKDTKRDFRKIVDTNVELDSQATELKNRINQLVNEKGGGYTSLHDLQKFAQGLDK